MELQCNYTLQRTRVRKLLSAPIIANPLILLCLVLLWMVGADRAHNAHADTPLPMAGAQSYGAVARPSDCGPHVEFGAPIYHNSPNAAIDAATGDLNGDGKDDIVTANYSAVNVSVLFGNGDGTFQAGVDYPVSNIPSKVTVSDLNRDGYPEI